MSLVVICPICKRDVTASEKKIGPVTFYSCDCAGFSRTVVEIHPPEPTAVPASKPTKKEA